MNPATEADAALNTLYGVVNSYVRGPRGGKPGATMADVDGQVKRARRNGAPEEIIRNRIRKGLSDPPYALPDRVNEITQMILLLPRTV